jgi:pectinesterase
MLTAARAGADVTVASDGSGAFKTVQEAVDAAPVDSKTRFVIHIKPGTYKGRVTVPAGKPMISFSGEDAEKTILTESINAHTLDAKGKEIGTSRSASVYLNGDDFIAEKITFENAAGNHGQAVAVSVSGDRVIFRHCRFLGWQDTVYLHAGRQLFEDCYIAGHVDFIFGAGTAYFDRCRIHCLAKGYVTAASTPENHAFGFVFSHCRITAEAGVKQVYLGRPWRPFGSVVFLETELCDAIDPAGWDNWRDPSREKTARFGEYRSTGPGAKAESRLGWSKQLAEDEAKGMTVDKVLGGEDHWRPE